MQFQTTVPANFEEKIKKLLSPTVSDRIIRLYTKINTADFVAGKIVTDGLINLFDLDVSTQEKVTNALEVFSERNIFLGSYFLKRVDVLFQYGILEDSIAFLTALMKYSGRKASYSLYRIDDALVLTTPQYVSSLLHESLRLMPQLEWASGVVVERAQVYFETFGVDSTFRIVRLGARLFPNRPLVLQFYFDEATNVFTRLTLLQAKYLFSRLSKESSDEVLRNQMHALAHLPKEDLLSLLSKKKSRPLSLNKSEDLKSIRLETLRQNQYINVFNYPEISHDLYFSAIFRRWHTFTVPVKENMLFALSKHDFRKYFLEHPDARKITAKLCSQHSEAWDSNHWIYTGEIFSEKKIIQLIDDLFTNKGKYFLIKPSILRRKLANYFGALQLNERDHASLTHILVALKKYTKEESIITVLDASLRYLKGDFRGSVLMYSREFIVAKIWDRDPWIDMARSDELFSCTFIGDYGDYSAPLYLYDNSVTFMDFFLNGKRKGRAYLVIAADEAGEEMLFVDIFEGSNTLLRGKGRFEFIIKAISAYAMSLKLRRICFNGLIYYNDTPRLFMDLLKESKFGQPYYQVIHKVYGPEAMRKLAPYPKPPFLNAFKINMTTLADGIIIDADEFMRRSL